MRYRAETGGGLPTMIQDLFLFLWKLVVSPGINRNSSCMQVLLYVRTSILWIIYFFNFSNSCNFFTEMSAYWKPVSVMYGICISFLFNIFLPHNYKINSLSHYSLDYFYIRDIVFVLSIQIVWKGTSFLQRLAVIIKTIRNKAKKKSL